MVKKEIKLYMNSTQTVKMARFTPSMFHFFFGKHACMFVITRAGRAGVGGGRA